MVVKVCMVYKCCQSHLLIVYSTVYRKAKIISGCLKINLRPFLRHVKTNLSGI